MKVEHGYQTSDEVLTNLLPRPSPSPSPESSQLQQGIITHNNILKQQDVNRLITATAKEVYRNYVKPKRQQSSSSNKDKPRTVTTRRKSSFKSNYKF